MKTSIWLLCCGMFCPGAHAQSVFGRIHGVVTDTSGAAVSGAKVTMRELEADTVTTVESTEEGLYEFLNVTAGLYELTAEKAGFSASRTPPTRLEARQARRADFQMEVAARSETIVVEARVPVVDTEDGTLSDSKNFEQLARLPLNFRGAGGTAISAILAFPGVQLDFYGTGWSIAGGLPAQTEVTVDGISAMYVPFHIPLANIAPSLETVSEMKLSSVGNDAAFGAMGDVTLSTRGGTNQLHGGLFWYHQNGALDANTYNSSVKAPKVFNNPGASAGGPVVLPRLYNGRSRTFFFADFETNLQRSWQLDQSSVPTANMRNGVLDGLPGASVHDPSTGAPFPDNRIPPTSISSVARVLLGKYYPLPNFPGDIANNYRVVVNDNQDTYRYDIRLDHAISAAQRVFVRWSWNDILGSNDSWPLLPVSSEVLHDRSFVSAHTYTPRASLSNELRYGFTLTSAASYLAIKGKDAVAALGLQGLDVRNAGDSGGFPAFLFSGDSGFQGIGRGRDQFVGGRNHQLSDILSWIRGLHTLKFGAELRHVGYPAALTLGLGGDDFGTFTFTGGFTGNDFADLLLGLPAASTTAVLGPNTDSTVNYFHVFAQDNWNIGRRFVLNLGLRAEIHPAMSERSGNMANFDPATGSIIIPDHSIAPAPGFLAAIGACQPGAPAAGCTQVLTASQAGLPAGLRRANTNWNPRLGFAWQPGASGKTAVRGGIGTYTATLLGPLGGGAMIGIASSDVRNFSNISSSGQPLFTFPNVAPSPTALGAIATASLNSGVAPGLRDPRSYQWNFTMARELPWRMTASVSYVGVQSVGMAERVDLNQVPASTQPFSPALRPFSHWVQLLDIQNLGFSNYQGMQAEWSRRFRNDLFFQASYQLAKDLGSLGTVGTLALPGESSNLAVTDRFNTRYDRGNLPGVRRQRFLLTALAPLPFGRGHAIGSNWSRVPSAFLGGWELSTVTLVESGPFQTPTVPNGSDQSNTDFINRRFARPDLVVGVPLVNRVGDQYYNPAAFAFVPNGAGRFGNAGAGILEGPGTAAIAAGLAKTFRPTERIRARFEATFRNIANHPNFVAPNTTLGNAAFGRLLSVWPSSSPENSGNRIGQLGVRVEF